MASRTPGSRYLARRREVGAVGHLKLSALDRKQRPQQRDGLAGQIRRIGAGQRALADGRHRPQPGLGGAAVGHVAADREENRAAGRLEDPPAHLADELRAVSPQAPCRGREAQWVLGGEVQLHVADVALAHPGGPERLHGLSEQFVPRIAEQLLGQRVHEHDASAALGRHHGIGQALEDRGRRDQQIVQPLVTAGARRLPHFFLGVHDL